MNVKAVGHGNLYRVETEKEVRNMIFLVEPTLLTYVGPGPDCNCLGDGQCSCDPIDNCPFDATG